MSAAHDTVVSREPLPRYGFILLALLTLFWGLNWPVMKIALAEVPVWWFRALCAWAGAIGLLSIAKLQGAPFLPQRWEVRQLLVVAAFVMFGWQVFAAYGIALMPAGRASVVAYTMPVWASLLGAKILNEPITREKILGLSLGLAGLAVLLSEDMAVVGKAPVGILFMLAAALCWAFGTVYFKKYTWKTPVITIVAWQLAASTVPLTLGAMLTETLPDLTQLSMNANLALIYTFALPMIFCQWAYFKVVSLFPASIAAIGTLAVPVIGIYSSAMMLNEPVGWREIIALILICAALVSVLVVPALKRSAPL